MSGDVRYPGWCCRQIAAQLSQALFTMADLHAQVSDLREENRQLKSKIESIDYPRCVEGVPLAKNAEEVKKESLESALTAHEFLIQEAENRTGTNRVHFLEEIKQHQHSRDILGGSFLTQSPSLNLDPKHERLVLNVPLKHEHDDGKGKSSQASTSQSGGEFKCEKCEYVFHNTDQLTSHQAVHIGRSFHVCKVCNAMFLLKADLHRHYMTHPDIKQHICQLCGKAYTSKNNYKLHIKTHTGVGLFPCEVCGKAFHSENHLNVHRRIHTGERPFECQYCDKSFTQKSGLINHTRLHTGEKPFLCPQCPKAFTQKSNLNFHLSKHHPAPENAPSEAPS